MQVRANGIFYNGVYGNYTCKICDEQLMLEVKFEPKLEVINMYRFVHGVAICRKCDGADEEIAHKILEKD